MMITPHFRPDIELGQIVQALILVVTLGGGIFGGYLTLRSDLDSDRAEFRVGVAGHEARLTMLEHALEERREDERAFEAETRDSLERITQAIADLKTVLAQKQDRP